MRKSKTLREESVGRNEKVSGVVFGGRVHFTHTFLEAEFVCQVDQNILDLLFTQGDICFLSPSRLRGGVKTVSGFSITHDSRLMSALTYGSRPR